MNRYGWAWNIRPRHRSTLGDRKTRTSRMWTVPTAETVESACIFAYGISNTWLERASPSASASLAFGPLQKLLTDDVAFHRSSRPRRQSWRATDHPRGPAHFDRDPLLVWRSAWPAARAPGSQTHPLDGRPAARRPAARRRAQAAQLDGQLQPVPCARHWHHWPCNEQSPPASRACDRGAHALGPLARALCRPPHRVRRSRSASKGKGKR